jgi:nucleotide-binding universal stress UspA family protein
METAFAVAGTGATYVLASAVPPVPLLPDYADPYAMVPVIVDHSATDYSAAATKTYLTKTAECLAKRGATVIEESVTVADQAAPALLDVAKAHDIDLIALATHGRGTSRFVFGSVADKILRGSSLPILVCRGGKE